MAHSTLILDELLPNDFKEYLMKPENNCYRLAGGTRVQVDATIALSNRALQLSCVCVIAPRSAVPNGRVGIILGQNMAIDRLVCKSVPGAVLIARGDTVDETTLRDLLLEEYVDIDGDIHRF